MESISISVSLILLLWLNIYKNFKITYLHSFLVNLLNGQRDTEFLMHFRAVFLLLLTDLLKKFLQEKQIDVAPYNLKSNWIQIESSVRCSVNIVTCSMLRHLHKHSKFPHHHFLASSSHLAHCHCHCQVPFCYFLYSEKWLESAVSVSNSYWQNTGSFQSTQSWSCEYKNINTPHWLTTLHCVTSVSLHWSLCTFYFWVLMKYEWGQLLKHESHFVHIVHKSTKSSYNINKIKAGIITIWFKCRHLSVFILI